MTYTPVCPHCRTGEPFYRSSCQGCQARKTEAARSYLAQSLAREESSAAAERLKHQASKIIETTKEMCDAQ